MSDFCSDHFDQFRGECVWMDFYVECMIYGTKGYLIAENINDITAVKVYTPDRELVREITMPEQITGFEYEVRASMKAIREGKLECMEMPHEESIRIMEQMDGLRKDWGIEYPFEKGNRPC